MKPKVGDLCILKVFDKIIETPGVHVHRNRNYLFIDGFFSPIARKDWNAIIKQSRIVRITERIEPFEKENAYRVKLLVPGYYDYFNLPSQVFTVIDSTKLINELFEGKD